MGRGDPSRVAVSGMRNGSRAARRVRQRRRAPGGCAGCAAPAAARRSAAGGGDDAHRRPGRRYRRARGAAEPPRPGRSRFSGGAAALRAMECSYRAGVRGRARCLCSPCGGFVPVVAELAPRRDRRLGAASSKRSAACTSSPRPRTPTATSGRSWRIPTPRRCSRPSTTVARRLGVKPPGQIRLTYLPCCGVVAWGRLAGLDPRPAALPGPDPWPSSGRSSHTSWRTWPGATPPAARSARFVEGWSWRSIRRATAAARAARRLGPLLPARARG